MFFMEATASNAPSRNSKAGPPFSAITSMTRSAMGWWNSIPPAGPFPSRKNQRGPRAITPSRGELEITDVNMEYLRRGQLRVCRLNRGFAWLDAGTSSSLHDASAYVQTIEKRQGVKLGCPEEAAFRRGFLSLPEMEALTAKMPQCEYRDYLVNVVAEAKRPN